VQKRFPGNGVQTLVKSAGGDGLEDLQLIQDVLGRAQMQVQHHRVRQGSLGGNGRVDFLEDGEPQLLDFRLQIGNDPFRARDQYPVFLLPDGHGQALTQAMGLGNL